MHKALRKEIRIKQNTWSEGMLIEGRRKKEAGNFENNTTDSQFIFS